MNVKSLNRGGKFAKIFNRYKVFISIHSTIITELIVANAMSTSTSIFSLNTKKNVVNDYFQTNFQTTVTAKTLFNPVIYVLVLFSDRRDSQI